MLALLSALALAGPLGVRTITPRVEPVDVIIVSHSIEAGDLQGGQFLPIVQRIMISMREHPGRGWLATDGALRFNTGDLMTSYFWSNRRTWGHVDPGKDATEAIGEVDDIEASRVGDTAAYYPEVVLIHHGENDIANGDTAAQALADLQTLCLTVKAQWPSPVPRVLVVVTADSASGAGEIHTLRDLIYNGGVTCADGLVYYGYKADGSAGVVRATAYDGGSDTTHPDVRVLPNNDLTWRGALDTAQYGTEYLAWVQLEAIFQHSLTPISGDVAP